MDLLHHVAGDASSNFFGYLVILVLVILVWRAALVSLFHYVHISGIKNSSP